MKIDELRIHNFQSIDNLTLPLAPVTLVTGPNGAGKSSIQAALEFLVSGATSHTNRQGYGLTDLVREGSNGAMVTAVFPGGEDSVTRSIPHALALTGCPSQMTLAKSQRRLEEIMGCSADRARLSLRAGRYFGMDEKDRTAVLYDLLGLHITDQLVQQALAERAECYGLPLVEHAERIMGGPVTANFALVHDLVYKERTALNKTIKSAQERLAAEMEQQALAEEPPSKEALDQVQRDHAALQTAEARLESARKSLDRALAESERLDKDVERLESELRQRPDRDGHIAAITKAEALLADLQTGLREAQEQQGRRAQAQARGRELKASLERLERILGGKGSCPLRSDYPCPAMTSAERPGLLAEHKSIMAEIAPLVPVATGPDRGADIQALQARIQKGEAWLREQRAALSQAESWGRKQGELDAKRQEQAQAQFRLAGARKEFDQQPSGADLEARRSEVTARKRDLEAKSQKARKWSEHVGALRAYRTTIAEGEKTREVLNDLLAFFGKEGLQRQLLAAKIEPIEAELNGILDKWGMACAYEMPTLELRVRPRPDSPFVSYQRLSDAEQIMVALAHQVVFSVLTGFRIVVLDRFEALDKSRQEALIHAALEVQDLVDHILLLGVSLRVTPPAGLALQDIQQLQAPPKPARAARKAA